MQDTKGSEVLLWGSNVKYKVNWSEVSLSEVKWNAADGPM
jgi:hypothetical protein